MKETNHKGHILYDSAYMKCPDQANSQTQSVDKRLPGLVGEEVNGEPLLMGIEFHIGVMKMWNYIVVMATYTKNHWIVYLKVNFIKCELHLKKHTLNIHTLEKNWHLLL